ncbi:MAG: hypothetical protein PHD05_00820 [Sphaerochaetaceae bacterium]|nr:hypothetical protein [Sphaerochaetaceae bacterium]
MIKTSNEDQYKIMEESIKALQKINEHKSQKKKSFEIIQEGLQKVTTGSEFFECYDSLFWEGKVKVDMLYFDQLLQNLEESEEIYKVLGTYFKNIRNIYEFVNLKPEIYGKKLDFTILEQTNEQQHHILSNILYEYFDKNFYSLTPDQRTEKYLEKSRDLSKQLISEGVSPEESIVFSTKTCLVENLLQKIAFPFAIWSRINYLLESEDYRKVFDQEALVELVDAFKSKTHSISKIIAAVV